MFLLALALLAASVGAYVAFGGGALLGRVSDALESKARPGRTGQFTTTNTSGRSGTYYFPASAKARAIPVLVALHGTGQSGVDMVTAFRDLAEQHGFAIVAPDSRRSPQGQLTWQVADKPAEITPDFTHVLACLAELGRHADGQPLLARKVLIAGYSGGASSAPYVATNNAAFSELAVLHGGVFAGGLGPRSIRAWFSTGDHDAIRSPEQVRAASQSLREETPVLTVYREFPGGHELSSAEKQALVEWWLQGG